MARSPARVMELLENVWGRAKVSARSECEDMAWIKYGDVVWSEEVAV